MKSIKKCAAFELLSLSISVFASLVGVAVGMTSSAVALNICAMTVRLKKYNWSSRKRIKTR